ncbi:MAG: hypothetical protein J0J01_18470 [Reyranella sp.]|uniref:hypothetical protein n=1 Tax=Reyranella sp. TaxID=1929291 RepID=UPI001ACDB1F6|nr:hypothetical protein [Reyranella sp.]MBN9088895.1 hypothetical protein [Reyranella sp.]
MSLCFIANKDLTVPFSDIARRLRARGEEIVWLSPSTRWTNWLIAEGWPKQDVVNLPDHADEWRDLSIEQAVASLADIEDEPPATISNAIQMCRNLKRWPRRSAYAYLAVARRHVEPILLQRKVEAVFGEGTWGFEILIWLLGQHHGIPVLTPTSTRIPGDRFYFSDAVTAGLHQFMPATEDDRVWATAFLDEWLNRPTQPEYMQSHTKGYQLFQRHWLRELVIGLLRPDLDRHDATLWPLHRRIADRTMRMVNALGSRYFSPFDRGPPGERYVLFPLHHQPEASVDVYGSLNSNQEALIATLSRILSATHKLWIKEHKGAIGDRSLGWYRRMLALPNVRLIDPFQDIYGLIRGADIVVTISGTPAYEAALMGVPALGLAPVFFSSLLWNQPVARSHPLEWQIQALLDEATAPSTAVDRRARSVEFLAILHANSCAGNPARLLTPSTARAQPDYLLAESEGIARFAQAIRRNKVALSREPGR